MLNIDENIKLQIVGGGPLLPILKEEIDFCVNKEKVLVTGYVNQAEYKEYISNFDVFLIPRDNILINNTAIPLKIFDAIENSIPIVMSNVKGLTEILDNKSAMIYDSSDHTEMVEKCITLYQDKKLRTSIVEEARKKLSDWPTFLQVSKIQLDYLEKS